jgi:hypothetical protein
VTHSRFGASLIRRNLARKPAPAQHRRASRLRKTLPNKPAYPAVFTGRGTTSLVWGVALADAQYDQAHEPILRGFLRPTGIFRRRRDWLADRAVKQSQAADPGHSPDISKRRFQNGTRCLESSRPSQPVRSPQGFARERANPRGMGLLVQQLGRTDRVWGNSLACCERRGRFSAFVIANSTSKHRTQEPMTHHVNIRKQIIKHVSQERAAPEATARRIARRAGLVIKISRNGR